MNRTFVSVLAFVAFGALSAYGQQTLSGTYLPKGQGLMDKLEFNSDGTVTTTAMGSTAQGPYTVNGQQVMITIGGQTEPFTIDGDGCLDGGTDIGKYCKQ
jgi:hypothetical protein